MNAVSTQEFKETVAKEYAKLSHSLRVRWWQHFDRELFIAGLTILMTLEVWFLKHF